MPWGNHISQETELATLLNEGSLCWVSVCRVNLWLYNKISQIAVLSWHWPDQGEGKPKPWLWTHSLAWISEHIRTGEGRSQRGPLRSCSVWDIFTVQSSYLDQLTRHHPGSLSLRSTIRHLVRTLRSWCIYQDQWQALPLPPGSASCVLIVMICSSKRLHGNLTLRVVVLRIGPFGLNHEVIKWWRHHPQDGTHIL